MSLSEVVAEIKKHAGRFYVYIIFRKNRTPLYVGCGAARGNRHERVQCHEMEARGSARSRRARVIRGLIARDEAPLYAIHSWHDSPAAVFAEETRLIRAIGRMDFGAGPLINGNDGGTGLLNASAEVIAKISASRRRRNEENPALGRAISERMRATMADPSRREHLRQRAIEQWADPSARSAASTRSRAAWSDPTRRAAAAERGRQQGATEDAKARFLARVGANRDEVLAKSIAARLADPTFAARMATIKKAQAVEKYALRDRCIARAIDLGVSPRQLPDHRAGMAVWREVAANMGLDI